MLNYNKPLWPYFALLLLGLWMIALPLTISHLELSMQINDIVSGILIFSFATFYLYRPHPSLPWIICLIGVWLQFAPLVFWAKNPVTYINDTFAGVLVIAFSIILPKEKREEALTGGGTPTGWSYNPSSWWQRIPIIGLGFLAWMFARYMAAFQLGYLDYVWDPIFGDGTYKVITSNVSKMFPVPDAGLGAMAYTIETLMGAHGSERRWHTIPWFVILFAILVVPLGFISILLIILQPIIVGHWCTWCLLTAVCMLFMIALALDEVVAVIQYLVSQKKEGNNWKKILIYGGDAETEQHGKNMPLPCSFSLAAKAMTWGISIPWNLCLTALLGLILMFAPHFLDIRQPFADGNHIVGSLVVALSVITMAEVARSFRYLIAILAWWPLISAWFLSGMNIWIQLSLGILLILFSIPKGSIKEKYGNWDPFIF